MNGRAAFYITGYNAKSQQKEERVAFEKLSEVGVKVMREQVCVFMFFGCSLM
jgi:hypothetical protein